MQAKIYIPELIPTVFFAAEVVLSGVNWLSVHAAVMAINEVLEKEDNDETFKALHNPAACLVDLQFENAPWYQGTLLKAKRDKTTKSGAQVRWPPSVSYQIL